MECPHCQSQQVVKNGRESLSDGTVVQRYRCKGCSKCFNDRTGTSMARLRTPSSVVATALKGRSEGLGVRATGRLFGASHSTILRWEVRLARRADAWSPPAPRGREVTLEGDEVYTRVGENLGSGGGNNSSSMKSTLAWARTFPPASSEGWTIHFIERQSRYWVSAIAGHTDELLFQRGTQPAWQWAKDCPFIRWFTDGEPRYGKGLWDLAYVSLALQECPSRYRTRKVWRQCISS